MIKLSVIILSWNTKQLLKDCLDSIVHSSLFNIHLEVIVVDNGSSDGSPPMVKKDFPQVKLIENKENLGFARGNNIGIKAARGEYIMLLNSDTIVKPRALEKLVAYLKKNPSSATSPLLKLPDNKLQIDYYMRFPNLWQVFFYHHPILRPLAMNSPLKKLICQTTRPEPFEVEQLPGAALMASRKVWQKVGELNADFHFLFEDVDWCWRARQKNVRLMVIPEAEIVHFGGASWKQKIKENSGRFYYQFFASLLLFVKKNYDLRATNLYKWAIIANFLLTLKPVLAFKFWQNDGQQLSFWR